jgi:hypothetical protein
VNQPAAPHRPAERPVVPATRFNFAAAVWDAKQRLQRNNLVAAGVAGLLLLAVVGLGWTTKGSTADVRSRQVQAQARAGELERQYKELTGGVEDLPGLLATRQGEVDAAFGNDVDVAGIVNVLAGAIPEGVTVKAVKLETTKAPTAQQLGLTTAYYVEVTATANDLSMPQLWQQKVSGIAELVSPAVDFPLTNGSEITMVLRAGIVDTVAQPRRADTRTRVGTPPSTTTTVAPTTTVAEGSNG